MKLSFLGGGLTDSVKCSTVFHVQNILALLHLSLMKKSHSNIVINLLMYILNMALFYKAISLLSCFFKLHSFKYSFSL